METGYTRVVFTRTLRTPCFPLVLWAATLAYGRVYAQEAPPAQPEAGQSAVPTTRLQVQSQLVIVPTAVQQKNGAMIYGLQPSQFLVFDNGVQQQVRLDDSGNVQPLSMVVAVQCSRTAWAEMNKMRGLETMVDAMIGGAPAEVAVVQFGTGEDLLSKFETDPDRRSRALAQLGPCEDGGDTIYDAVEYAGQLLEAHKAKGRRIVLLVSETRDHGSDAKAEQVLEQMGRGNITVDSLSFSPFRDEQVDAAKYERGSSILNPASLIYTLVQALRTNAPKTLAKMSGGEYINFGSQKGFDRSLLTLANHVNNYYLLSFQPRFPADAERMTRAQPGLHTISVSVPLYPGATVRHRDSYWAEPPAQEPKRP